LPVYSRHPYPGTKPKRLGIPRKAAQPLPLILAYNYNLFICIANLCKAWERKAKKPVAPAHLHPPCLPLLGELLV